MAVSCELSDRCFAALAVFLAFSGVFISAEHMQAAPLRLLENGVSRHVIVLSPTASPSEKTAAAELQSCFEQCTDVKLLIVAAAPQDGRPMILLGHGPAAAAMGVEPSDEQLGEQGCVIRTVDPHLVIVGTAAGGTLWGTRRFLEDELGVRWYAPGVTKMPKQTEISIGPIDCVVEPGFHWRQTSYAWPGGGVEFRARRGLNSGAGGADHPQGVQYAFDGTCHSYFRFVSPDEFFDAHPEYFSEINGRRVREETQLCLTNPDVLDIVSERMLARMKAHPHFRQHNFSQMDWYNCCECEKCRAMNEKYKSAGGTQFWFVNELAKRTSKVFPHKLIGTLAYMYTEEPPVGLEIHENVAVWLCHMFPSCDSHAIETCPLNAEYKRRARAWSKICRHLYAWHYIVNFAHYYTPFPNFRAMDADFKFYKSLGFEGVYAQAMGNRGGGEFSLLRGYLSSELLKNPSQKSDDVVRDFLDGYYGPAAGPIGEYITLLHDKVEKENIHMHLYTNPAQGYLDDEVLRKAELLFDRAADAVKHDAELLDRVQVARMPLTYAKWFPRNGYEIVNGSLVFKKPLGTPAKVHSFAGQMEAHGFRSVRERGGDPGQLAMLSMLMNLPLPLATIKNQYLQVEVLPSFGGRVLRIIDRETGKCATAYNTTKNLLFPFCGGEDSRIGGIYTFDKSGVFTPAAVVKQTADRVVLKSKIPMGLELRRTISLAAGRPAVIIRLETVNPGDKPREVQMRSHTSFDLGDITRVHVNFTSLCGDEVNKGMADIIARLRRGERYYQSNCPRGSWTFSGPKGLDVTQRFDNRQVDFTWLYAYPAELNELEAELWAKKVVLAPGQSGVLEHEIEIRSSNNAK